MTTEEDVSVSVSMTWALYKAVDETVEGVVDETVEGAIGGSVYSVVDLVIGGAVRPAIFGAVDWAMHWAVRRDPSHPALLDFLAAVGAEAP